MSIKLFKNSLASPAKRGESGEAKIRVGKPKGCLVLYRNPRRIPAVRIYWKFSRKELLILIYEGEKRCLKRY